MGSKVGRKKIDKDKVKERKYNFLIKINDKAIVKTINLINIPLSNNRYSNKDILFDNFYIKKLRYRQWI